MNVCKVSDVMDGQRVGGSGFQTYYSRCVGGYRLFSARLECSLCKILGHRWSKRECEMHNNMLELFTVRNALKFLTLVLCLLWPKGRVSLH